MATKSDYYTHIMDIPPQYGSGQTVEEAGVRIIFFAQITTHTSDYCTRKYVRLLHTHASGIFRGSTPTRYQCMGP